LYPSYAPSHILSLKNVGDLFQLFQFFFVCCGHHKLTRWGFQKNKLINILHAIYQNTRQNHNLITGNKSLKNVAKLKYMWITDKSKLYLWRNEEQIQFGECLLSISVEFFCPFWRLKDLNIYQNMILPVLCMGVKLGPSH
jgi:hypothetical protein